MIFVVSLDNRISEEVIIVIYVLALVPCPFNILPFPSKSFPIIHQAQYQINPMLLASDTTKSRPWKNTTIQLMCAFALQIGQTVMILIVKSNNKYLNRI